MDSKSYKHSYKFSEKILTSLSVYNVGQQQCESCFKWGPGIRDHFIFHYIVSGCGKYTVNNKMYNLEKGDTFIIYPNTTVIYEADSDKPYEYYWVGFNGTDALSLIERTDFTIDNPVIKFKDNYKIKEYLANISACRGLLPQNNIKMTANLYTLIAFMVENSRPKELKDSGTMYLNSAIEYISKNYATDISINTIAEYIGISRSSLYRIFVKHINMSPVVYLNNFRIKKACSLLTNSNLSIEEVATSVGFSDPFYFSRIFKKHLGVPPTKYFNKYI